MTTIVTQVTWDAIAHTSFEQLSNTVGVIAIALLVMLLVTREMFRAYDETRADVWQRIFNIAIMPLLMSFSVIIVVRFAHLLG